MRRREELTELRKEGAIFFGGVEVLEKQFEGAQLRVCVVCRPAVLPVVTRTHRCTHARTHQLTCKQFTYTHTSFRVHTPLNLLEEMKAQTHTNYTYIEKHLHRDKNTKTKTQT